MEDAKRLRGAGAGECLASRQKSAELRLELQANQAVVEGLSNWYRVFAFTGGAIPTGHCQLVAVNSYLESPLAVDRILIGEVERYRILAESIAMAATEIPARPRTLRDRRRISDAFCQVAAEIQSLGSKLDLALTV